MLCNWGKMIWLVFLRLIETPTCSACECGHTIRRTLPIESTFSKSDIIIAWSRDQALISATKKLNLHGLTCLTCISLKSQWQKSLDHFWTMPKSVTFDVATIKYISISEIERITDVDGHHSALYRTVDKFRFQSNWYQYQFSVFLKTMSFFEPLTMQRHIILIDYVPRVHSKKTDQILIN